MLPKNITAFFRHTFSHRQTHDGFSSRSPAHTYTKHTQRREKRFRSNGDTNIYLTRGHSTQETFGMHRCSPFTPLPPRHVNSPLAAERARALRKSVFSVRARRGHEGRRPATISMRRSIRENPVVHRLARSNLDPKPFWGKMDPLLWLRASCFRTPIHHSGAARARSDGASRRRA